MSFAVVLEGMTLIAYMVILAGGKQKREAGWGVLSGLHVVCAVLQCAGMAIIVSSFFVCHWRRSGKQSDGSLSALYEWRSRLTYVKLCFCQAYLYDNDDRFFPGWKLDVSWILCTISWGVTLLLGAGISAAAVLLPSEGGYELIPHEEIYEE